jgi:hypothetical protein
MGRTINLSLNLDELPADQAATLSGLISDADFFHLPADTTTRPAPDEFIYILTVDMEKKSHTVRTSDTSAPPKLAPLLSRLSLLARTRSS